MSDWYLEVLARSLNHMSWLLHPGHADYRTKLHLYTNYAPPATSTITYPKTEISMISDKHPYPPKVDVPGYPKNRITLDPDDPFDAALIPIVETNRRKRRDYAADGDPFSNFVETSSALGIPDFGPIEAADFNIAQKQARLKALRQNGRMQDPANEAVIDTYLDRAVYSIIAYALALRASQGESRAD